MGHKVNPKIFRISHTTNWDSRWLDRKKFPEYLEEDFKVREFLTAKLKDCGVEKIEIERFPGKVNIIINSSRPGLVIGRGGEGVETIKKELLKKAFKTNNGRDIKIEIREVKNPWSKAELAGQWIAQQLEKRLPYRKVMKQGLEKIMLSRGVKGARIEISGRLGGVEIARRDWLAKGRLPRQTLKADIDYAANRANCTYGVLGVKTWIYREEDKQNE